MRLSACACLPVLALVLGCAGAPPPGAAPPPTSASTAKPSPAASPSAGAPSPAMPTSAIRRSAVREVLAAGPGAFLGHVAIDVENPVFLGGRFHGFRIQSLTDPGWWKGVDLRAGDVVTRVNGFSIEHPEEALEAFQSLNVSSELRVSYERDGAPRELRYSIIDDMPVGPAAPPRNEVR